MKLNEVAISQLFEGCLVKVKKPINKSCFIREVNWGPDTYGEPRPSKDIKIPAEYFKVLEIDNNYNHLTIKFFNDYDYMWEQPTIEFDRVQLDDICNEYNKKWFKVKEQSEQIEAIKYIGDVIAKAIISYG